MYVKNSRHNWSGTDKVVAIESASKNYFGGIEKNFSWTVLATLNDVAHNNSAYSVSCRLSFAL